MKAKTKSKKKTTKKARPRKKLTRAEEQARTERRAKLDALVARVEAMTPAQREAMRERFGVIVNCEGRPLSPNNTDLIIEQAGEKEASMVGGFVQWRRVHNRTVMKDQHGYVIKVPLGKKSRDDGTVDPDARQNFGFRHVFDITQTEPLADGPEGDDEEEE